MKHKIFALIALVTSCVCAAPASAALIINGSQSVNALTISETFESFYAYSTTVGGSSSTGYEINDTVTLFVVENSGQYALVGLVDGTSETGDTTGGLMFLTLEEMFSSLNTLIVSDDLADSEEQTPNKLKFTFGFGAGKNDGFVYSLGTGSNVDILLGFQYVRDISDAVFLSFDGSNINQYVLGNSVTLQGSANVVSVNAPSSLLSLALGLILLVRLKSR